MQFSSWFIHDFWGDCIQLSACHWIWAGNCACIWRKKISRNCNSTLRSSPVRILWSWSHTGWKVVSLRSNKRLSNPKGVAPSSWLKVWMWLRRNWPAFSMMTTLTQKCVLRCKISGFHFGVVEALFWAVALHVKVLGCWCFRAMYWYYLRGSNLGWDWYIVPKCMKVFADVYNSVTWYKLIRGREQWCKHLMLRFWECKEETWAPKAIGVCCCKTYTFAAEYTTCEAISHAIQPEPNGMW